jgi:hypothetical protein
VVTDLDVLYCWITQRVYFPGDGRRITITKEWVFDIQRWIIIRKSPENRVDRIVYIALFVTRPYRSSSASTVGDDGDARGDCDNLWRIQEFVIHCCRSRHYSRRYYYNCYYEHKSVTTRVYAYVLYDNEFWRSRGIT